MIIIENNTMIDSNDSILCEACHKFFKITPVKFYVLKFGDIKVFKQIVLCEKCYTFLKDELGSKYYTEGLQRGDW
jgi:hypothetical protein